MCQPGLPLPHGDSQKGSSGLEDFQSAKSPSDSLFKLSFTLVPDNELEISLELSIPYFSNLLTLK